EGALYATFDSFALDPNQTPPSIAHVFVSPALYRIDPTTGNATFVSATDLNLSALVDRPMPASLSGSSRQPTRRRCERSDAAGAWLAFSPPRTKQLRRLRRFPRTGRVGPYPRNS